MTWDLKLNPNTRDLTAGITSGVEEVMQRLITRLNRELGEWYLNTAVGLPWYQEGNGLLGSKSQNTLVLLVRRETLGTQGINRIVTLNARFNAATRALSLYMELVVENVNNDLVAFRIDEQEATWRILA